MGRGQRHGQGARPLRRPGRGRRLGLRRRRVRVHRQKRKLQTAGRCRQPLRLRLRACGLRRSGGKGRGALFPPAARRRQILRFYAAPPCGRRFALRVHRHCRSADMGAEGVCETRGGGRRHRRYGPQLRRHAFPRHLLRRHRVARPFALRPVQRSDGAYGHHVPQRDGQPRHEGLRTLLRNLLLEVRADVRSGLLFVRRRTHPLCGARRQLLHRARLFLHRLSRRAADALARKGPCPRAARFDGGRLPAYPFDLRGAGPQAVPLRPRRIDDDQPQGALRNSETLPGAYHFGPYPYDLQPADRARPLRACDTRPERRMVAGSALHRRHARRVRRL